MRPVERGGIPQENGADKVVSDYKDWRQDLIDRIGNCCSYCNITLNDSPQVEHVTPKNPRPGQVAGALLAWDNMLLACGPCNRAKGNQPNSNQTHYIPDYHNTHLAFEYVIIDHPRRRNQKACIPIPVNIAIVNNQKALDTIDLCKLQALTSNPRATDLRWKYRFEAWYSANAIWRIEWNNWGHTRPQEFGNLLVDAAKSKGFFSVWYKAFIDVRTIKQRLVNAFPGTHLNSFDNQNDFNPVQRNANDL